VPNTFVVWTLKGHNALNIRDDAPIITYLQIGENLTGLTSKEWDCVVHKAKQFKWEGIFHFVSADIWMSGGGDSPKEMSGPCVACSQKVKPFWGPSYL